jgi:putative phosphoribosyl transferase
MTCFENRNEAGKLLAQKLSSYKNKDAVVLALPRGGVPVAYEISKILNLPLDLIFAHKIGHPLHEEYAVAAINESGNLVGNSYELSKIDSSWLEKEKLKVLDEIKKRRTLFLRGKKITNLKNKIVILVDDGIATGYTLRAAILEAKNFHPSKIVIAVPVTPENIYLKILNEVDEFCAVLIEKDEDFLGSVGAYYGEFNPVDEGEICALF